MADLLSVSSANIQTKYTVGGVSTTSFAIPWPFFDLDDVAVYVDDVLKVRGTDYDITAIEAEDIGYTGGTVILTTGVTSVTVIVQRDTPITRESDFPRGSTLSLDVLNRDLDKLTAIAQELAWSQGRTVRITDTDISNPSLYLPSTAGERANLLVGFDETGQNLVLAAPTGTTLVSDPSKVPLSRTINAGTGLSGGGDLSADRTINMEASGVTPGSYTSADITVDSTGRVTAAANGSGGSGGGVPTSRAINVSSPISGGGALAADVTISHATSGATPGTYQNATLTVNNTGHVTSIASNPSGVNVPQTRLVNTSGNLTGGGNLTADRTITMATQGAVTPGTYNNANVTVDQYGVVTNIAAGSAGSGSLSWVDVTAYGATGDGSTDDAASVNSAIAALNDSPGSVLYFPRGTYKLGSGVTIDKQNVVVLGDGEGVSRILVANNTLGMQIQLQGADQKVPTVIVKGLAFEQANGNNGATALKIENTTPAYSEMRISLSDLIFRGYEVHTTGTAFGTGIHLLNVGFINLNNIDIWGHDDGGSVSGEYGIRWQETDGNSRFGFTANRLSITGVHTGLSFEGWIEGVYLNGGEIWECEYCIVADRTGEVLAGSLKVSNFHLNAGTSCVRVVNMNAISLTNNDIYKGCTSASLTAKTGSLVDLESCVKITITGNTIQNAFDLSGINGVVLNGCTNFAVTGNAFMLVKDVSVWVTGSSSLGIIAANSIDSTLSSSTGIYMGASVSAVSVNDNRISNFATTITNLAGDSIQYRHHRYRGARVTVNASTTSSVSNGVDGNVSSFFNSSSEDYDVGGLITGGEVVIPANQGIRRVRITFNVVMTGSGTSGPIKLQFHKNSSSTWAGSPRTVCLISNGETAGQLTTGVINVSDGDTFTPHVFNQSGGTVTLASGGSRSGTWMEVEVLE